MGSGFTSHHQSYEGKTNIWLTPPWVLKALGSFDLDPCAAPNYPLPRPWKTATTMWNGVDVDGLETDWFGRVWLNPPYGPHTGKWLEKLVGHGNGIALVFARTDTRMFNQWVWPHADALLFIKGRLFFHFPSGVRSEESAGAPSVLIAYGKENARMLKLSGIEGGFVSLR